MNIKTRIVDASDCEDIAQLSSQLGYAISLEDTKKNIQLIIESINDIAYVALVDDLVVGWIHIFYTVRIESTPFCEIGGMVTDAEHRSKGIGKALIEATKEWCRAKGVAKLRVRSNVKRTDAHRFYLNAGFKEMKEQKVFEIAL